MDTKYHRNQTVTYWSTLDSRWVRRADHVPDRDLATMTHDERERIMDHLGYSEDRTCSYGIVTHGRTVREDYDALNRAYSTPEAAIRAASRVSTVTPTVRVVKCHTPSHARVADIGDPSTYIETVWTR